MFIKIFIVFFLILINHFSISDASAGVKLRDLAQVEGIRYNQLFGYGLVAGLNGSGDKTGTEFTIQSLVNMLDRLGISVLQEDVRIKNVAAVMVTAKLPPFAKSGTRIDVTVSSIGDADSLEGGTLLLTPLSAANGQIYAIAQGAVSIGGSNSAIIGAGAIENHPTVGIIPNGASVEKEIDFDMDKTHFNLAFTDRGISDIVKAKSAINKFVGAEIAVILNPSTVRIDIPERFKSQYYDFMSTLLSIEIQPESFAKVIIDERTGTIVMGSDVRISTVAVAHGNLNITITDQINIQQPGEADIDIPLAPEATATPQNTSDSRLMMIPAGVTISDLVKALNSLGVTSRDLIAILQAIKSAGALYADLEVM